MAKVYRNSHPRTQTITTPSTAPVTCLKQYVDTQINTQNTVSTKWSLITAVIIFRLPPQLTIWVKEPATTTAIKNVATPINKQINGVNQIIVSYLSAPNWRRLKIFFS